MLFRSHYLKRTVSWEVEDYETNIFRGWSLDEVRDMLGVIPEDESSYPEVEEVPLPSEINWAGGNCDHGVRNQGNCGSCWAFAGSGMLSDRCCLMKSDAGWLAPQELVSCDRSSNGCHGGQLDSPANYFRRNHGLVPEKCFPYL